MKYLLNSIVFTAILCGPAKAALLAEMNYHQSTYSPPTFTRMLFGVGNSVIIDNPQPDTNYSIINDTLVRNLTTPGIVESSFISIGIYTDTLSTTNSSAITARLGDFTTNTLKDIYRPYLPASIVIVRYCPSLGSGLENYKITDIEQSIEPWQGRTQFATFVKIYGERDIPEPSTAMLLTIGLTFLLIRRHR